MSRPGFYICAGPDSVLLKEHIRGLLAANPPAAGREWEWYVFWGDEPLGSAFWEKLTLQGLFAAPRALILRNAQNLPADVLKKLSEALGRVSEQIWPFLCLEVEFERGKLKLPAHIGKLMCLRFAQQQGWYREIPPLTARELRNFLQAEAARQNLALGPDELESLASSLPPDAGAIRLELQKIALACPDGKLTPEALSLLDYQADIDIFAFLQGLQNGKKPAEVWGQYLKDHAASADSGLFSFIAILLREGRILWQLLVGESVFLPPQVIGAKTALARSLGFGGLGKIWDLALQADKGVKTGERSPQQAFEVLIAGLFRLFKAA